MNKTLSLVPGISWVGVLDYDIVSFDIVMETAYGTTYNSYFIDSGKKTLIETVKESFHAEYIEKLGSLVNPAEISYIVLNHTEPDHSGSLKHLLKLAPEATVVGSGNAIRYLRDMVGSEFRQMQVKDGDILDIGGKTLRFISAPNLHWPDTMYTYLEEDRLLFSCDSFGSHYCHEKMFDDEVGDFDDAFKYYFDVILKPYSRFMIKAIGKVRQLPVNMVCTGHGPILRTNWRKYMDLSDQWSREYLEVTGSVKPRVLIAYISAYGYTAGMADAIARGIARVGGIEVEMADIEKMMPGEMEAKLIRCNALLIGSPTINQNTLLPVYKFLSLVNPLRDKGKAAAVFGSYGWSGEAVRIIEDNLKNLKLNLVQQGASFKFHPGEEKIRELEKFGEQFASRLEKTEKQGD